MHIGILSEQDKQALERGMLIANAAVIHAVISYCALQRCAAGVVQYDTRPMLDPREVKPATLDWHAELLSYGESVGLLQRDSAERHLVKIARPQRT